jgi:protocatechuate 3,4-dioxygenase beta subunit
MSKHARSARNFSRREALKACLVPAGLAATGWLIACSEEDEPAGLGGFDAGVSGGSPDAAAALDAASPRAGDASTGQLDASAPQSDANAAPPADATADASAPGALDATADARPQSDASGAANPDASNADVPWASGGTKSMQGNYPDPFTTGSMGAMCTLYPSQTLGPCYAQMPATREDISDGVTGLPVRLSLLVVRSDGCTPIPNAIVDVWHSGFNGVYSAYATGTICTPGSENVLSQRYCRGLQVTDASGKANFSTIFPGWYTGRTIHIHFTVRLNGRDAVTSQLYFEDPLSDEILAQGEYAARGRRDTTNQNDSLFRSGGATPAQVVFSTAKRHDGVLHAWKVLSIRAA